MKIILLSGNPNSGKSTTLNLVFDTITANGTKNIIAGKTVIGNPNQKDFKCVVQYNNKEVGIFTMGDYYIEIIKAIIAYANMDVLILAYSAKFKANLDTYIKSCACHCVIKKTTSNNADCNAILAQI
jgi:tRNA uridine 5-carbamoylmethylation protein Kti12